MKFTEHGVQAITTRRLRLLPSTADLTRAEMDDRHAFARLIGVNVPENWPPESAADALGFFLGLLTEHPSWVGWLGWYAIADVEGDGPTLVGSGGFFGPPSGDGEIETGYSVLPQFQRRGFATEMLAGLIGWASAHVNVSRIVARTAIDNTGSRKVLEGVGFVEDGLADEPDHLRYALESLRVGRD